MNSQVLPGQPKAPVEAETHRQTIALLLPTLNELQGLQATLPLIDRSLVDDIIVVDGGSRDGTVEYAAEAGLTVVTQLRPGLHFAIFDIGRALDHDYAGVEAALSAIERDPLSFQQSTIAQAEAALWPAGLTACRP